MEGKRQNKNGYILRLFFHISSLPLRFGFKHKHSNENVFYSRGLESDGVREKKKVFLKGSVVYR